ncbi:zinc ribbon domain-containing protein [Candidatus Eisenbacteria bacterium]|uniref:Zinc ribbon domain-containing protein n=1 Tax=Eiseniibacteriota bacterium TaxID=2212470 RepID=A0ABV6YL44_UNCEI
MCMDRETRSPGRRVSGLVRPVTRLLLVALLAIGILLTLPAQADMTSCGFCGGRIDAEALYCTYCGRPLGQPETIYCWRCGTALSAESHFCHRCGSRVCGVGSHAADSVGVASTRVPEIPRPASRPATPPTTGIRASGEGASATQAATLPADRTMPSTRPERPTTLLSIFDKPDIILPPQLFVSPTGIIIPSLTFHVSGGGAFGLSEKESTGGWLLSFGLGNVGEAMIASSRILHVIDTETHSLAGFRLRLPVSLLSKQLSENLSLAVNIASMDRSQYNSTRALPSSDGVNVQSLAYSYRETTLGLSATWRQGATRIHGIIHTTDLRTEGIRYFVDAGSLTGSDKKQYYQSYAAGLDYALNPRSFLICEIRTRPRMTFRAKDGDTKIENMPEYAGGLRFYPITVLGMDVFLSGDEEVVGLADLEIGFRLHLTVGPRRQSNHAADSND